MKIVNNCIDCVYDFQMRESCRDKLVHAMPTDLKSRYERELLYNKLLKEDFKVISNSDFEGYKD